MDDALDAGNIVANRGRESNESLESLVLLSQAPNVQLKNLNNDDILECLNAAPSYKAPKTKKQSIQVKMWIGKML